MPFVRYDTGDLGILSSDMECKCGFKGISLSKIAGRDHDIIVLSDGTKVSLTAFIFGQHLEAFKRIREMQVIQHKIGEIELRIVKNHDFTLQDEENTKRTLLNSVNNKIIITFSYIDSVPKTPRGKNIFFVSNIKLPIE
jgi:phenylacetate-CoA ligase